jgi:hypothetical protein
LAIWNSSPRWLVFFAANFKEHHEFCTKSFTPLPWNKTALPKNSHIWVWKNEAGWRNMSSKEGSGLKYLCWGQWDHWWGIDLIIPSFAQSCPALPWAHDYFPCFMTPSETSSLERYILQS